VVECDLAKVEVAGSNPVSRFQNLRRSCTGGALGHHAAAAVTRRPRKATINLAGSRARLGFFPVRSALTEPSLSARMPRPQSAVFDKGVGISKIAVHSRE
jgi:hypothetical protein